MNYDHHVSHFSPGASISRESFVYLHKMIRDRPYQSVIEFGPGLSSILLLEGIPNVMFIDEISEHHETWLSYMESLGFSPNHKAVAVHSDHSYDMSSVHLSGPYDLVVIDGPWNHLGRWTPRIKDVYQEVIGPCSDVVVDDSHRSGEQEIVFFAQSIVSPCSATIIQDEIYQKRTTTIVEYLGEVW